MALRDDIDAVLADETLTEDEKRAQVYALKVNAIVTRAQFLVGQSWLLDGVNYRLNAVRGTVVRGTLCLDIDFTRTALGYAFDPSDIVRITNPPAGSDAKGIDEMTNAERLAFLKSLIAGLPPGREVG